MGPSGRITHMIGLLDYIALFGTGYAGIVFGWSSPYKGDSARFYEVASGNPTTTCIPRVTRQPLVFRGLTGSQRTPGFGASHRWFCMKIS